MSCSALHSPPPSPHPAPVPLPLSTSVTVCPELDLSVTLSPTPKAGHPLQKPHPLKQGRQNDPSQMKCPQRGRTGKKRNVKVGFEEPVNVTVTPEPHLASAQQPIRGQRRNTVHRHARRHSEPPAATCAQSPGLLERAELNSTLVLKAKLQSLQEAEFNSQKALQETLKKSERTKNLINARATEVVNVSRSQQLFNSLVSVSVQKDQLISQVLQDRPLLPLPATSHSHDARETDGPSLLFFMTPDLFRQKPLPQEEEQVSCKPLPMPRPAYSTFDLYMRQRCWEATP